MRLIDADALIKKMKKVETDYEDAMTRPSWWTAYSVVSEQPTAYDVEKVVAELEEKKNESLQLWKKYKLKDDAGKMFAFSESIKIVKRGGVE